MFTVPLYRETHRPQFHFSPKRDWMNDPNGLVYYDGEYHLFFQHTPGSLRHGPNTWGHAVSADLVHWRQIEHALEPDDMGWIWSGSAVVDHRNTGGFQSGAKPSLVAFYTVGDTIVKPQKPCVQCIAYSNDWGRTWTKYAGNPVIGHIRDRNRDPKVIWHEPSGTWIMALYLVASDYTLFHSTDLKNWKLLGELALPGVSECPDFFELSVDGDPDDTRWVYWGGNGGYVLGRFDGRTFTPETGVLNAEKGTNGYAAQTWSDIPSEDGRRIQISWMAGGKFPAMPFTHQMSFPVELTLRRFPSGIQLCRLPAREIETLYAKTDRWTDLPLRPGADLIPHTDTELFDITLEIEPGTARNFGVELRGLALTYSVAEQTVEFKNHTAALASENGRVTLRLLIDRTSLEVFDARGALSMSFCFLPEAADYPLRFFAGGGEARILALTVNELRSIWENQ
ncbi:MAG: glycoside hydrolase family 32 protein [candidate division Zixibacteria bacterium]|nr:glycoside hydrolase family 32 protein [candidate division Zixibacteria bacterium]